MDVNEVKHQAKLLEWKEKVADCRSSGVGVKHWCEENGFSPKTYYRWEREILGKARRIAKAQPQPVLAELAVVERPLQVHPAGNASFIPAARIRFGQIEYSAQDCAPRSLRLSSHSGGVEQSRRWR